jgi:hypothetical protein
MVGTLALPTLRSYESQLVPHFRFYEGLANLGAAVGALIGEIDLRQAPMRLHVAHEHWKSDTARTDDEVRFDIVVQMDIGWHGGSPQESFQQTFKKAFTGSSRPRQKVYAFGVHAIMNSRERKKNIRTIPACVAYLHDRVPNCYSASILFA